MSLTQRSPVIFWRPLTIVFGALPATWLGIFAAMGVWLGVITFIANVTSGDLMGTGGAVLISVWSTLGLYGVIALWAVGLGFVNTFSMLGLVAGLLAAFPFVMFIVLTGDMGLSEITVLLPTIVGSAWLYRMHAGGDAVIMDDELERDLAELRERGTSWQ